MRAGDSFTLVLDAEVMGSAKSVDFGAMNAVLSFNPAIFTFDRQFQSELDLQGAANVKDGQLFLAPFHIPGVKLKTGEFLRMGGKINDGVQPGTYQVSVDAAASAIFMPDNTPIETEWQGVSVIIEKTNTGVKVKFTFRIE